MIATKLRAALRSRLLVVPAGFVAGAILLSVAVSVVDVRTGFGRILFPGDAQSARTLLGTVATGTVTLMGLVFSVTMLVIQLTSSQYSPRVLGTFLRDRNAHFTLGVFAGTFAFSLASLRAVTGDQVPETAVSLAVLFAFVTLATFVQYINHVARKIRVNSVIESVANDAAVSIETFLERARVEQHQSPPPRATPAQVASSVSGFVVAVDHVGLVALAEETDSFVDVVVAPGDFVRNGRHVMTVMAADASDGGRFLRHLDVDAERDVGQDPLYGLRQLVDIAQRALSPSMNDPTTAAQVVGFLHDLLARLAPHSFPRGVICDDDGTARVRVVTPTWDDVVRTAVDELIPMADDQLQVLAALHRMLSDLRDTARPERAEGIEQRRAAVARRIDSFERRLLAP
ncbi:MAG TPA: DUF2254 domain-containing protein [Acidimicrobiales bacterium]|nr:DUF2254 domain-containing protein [Acidimicrobiales bacterium]